MKKPRLPLLLVLIFLLAVLLRLGYYLEYSELEEFRHPTVDALYHHLTASAIADGALTNPEPFFRAPFYNYFLGFIYSVTGKSIGMARLFQLLLGALTPVLVFFLATRLFDRRAGYVAALLTALCGDLVYFEGELLLESLLVSEFLLVWLALLRFRTTGALRWLIISGLLTGIAIVTRPNAIVLALLCIPMILRTKKGETVPAVTRLLLFVLPLLLPLALTLAHNLTREQPAFTVATQGGINFYLGNNAAADGVSAVMPGKLSYSWQYEDIEYLAESEAGRELSPSQVSSFYYGKALHDLRERPLRWLKLMVRKIFLFFSGFDLSNNRNITAFRSEVGTLKIMPLGMWFLAPLGLVGIVLAWRRSVATRVVALFTMAYAMTFVLFFVNSRFRLPLLPFLALFAAHLLLVQYDLIRRRAIPRALVPFIACLALLALLNTNLYRLDFSNREQALLNKANLALTLGDNREAIRSLRSSLSAAEPLKQVYLNLGVAYLRLGEIDSARKFFEIEDSLFGGSAEALSNLSYLARQSGDFRSAAAYAKRALADKPYLESARLNLWYAWRSLGFSDSAYADIAQRAGSTELSRQETFLLGVTALDLGLPHEAIARLHQVLAAESAQEQPTYSEAATTAQVVGRLPDEEFNSRVCYNLGTAFGIEGALDSAAFYLRAALQLDPGFAEAWVNLGSAYLAGSKYEDARQALQTALDLGVESEVLQFNLALANLALADTSMAIAGLRRSLELNPGLIQAQTLLEQLQIKKAGGNQSSGPNGLER